MNPNLSTRDFESLSAYLDGQLPEREKARLEARLDQDTGLQQALQSLERTRRTLRAAPRLRAPRNFTLTPEMVQSRSPRFLPAVRFAFALATLMFVLSLAGNYAFAPLAQPSTAAMPAETFDMEEAPQTLQLEAQEEPLAVEEMVEEMSPGEGEVPAEAEAAAAAEEPVESLAEDSSRSGEAMDAAGESAPAEQAPVEGTPTLKQQPTSLPEPGTEPVEAQPAANPWIVAAAVSGLVAVSTGAYLFFRRRSA